jgi:DNA-binding transcriptional LysR family regulator
MQRTGLESRRLQHFRTVYERGSLSAAAAVLFVSQPALSSSISTLERQLGVRLFERTSLGTRPTVYGEALYRRSQLVQAELELAVEEIRALEEGRAGRVRIGAGASVVELLATVVARVLAERPNLVVALTEGPESQLLGAVRNGDLDLAVCTLSATTADPEMLHEPLYTSVTVPLVRRGHPLTRQPRAGWRDLARFPFVVADSRVEPLDQRALEALSVEPIRRTSCATWRSAAISSRSCRNGWRTPSALPDAWYASDRRSLCSRRRSASPRARGRTSRRRLRT